MLYINPFDQFRIWLTKFFKKEESNSTFLTTKPKLTKIEPPIRLNYNETFNHIFKQVKQ